MKKSTIYITIGAVLVLGFLIWKAPISSKVADKVPVAEAPSYSDYKNTSYAVGGQNVFLKNGIKNPIIRQ